MNIKPIRRVNVSEQVFEQMKGFILSGDWAPGDRLPSENSLAESFGVSRITVRQGIHRLVALGLAETLSGEGTFIRTLTPGQAISSLVPAAYLGDDNMRTVMEFRRAIEVYTAELAAQKATEEDVAQLESIYDEMKREKDNIEAFSEADYNFHHELAVISRNPLILESCNLIADVLRSAFKSIVEKRGNSHGLYYHRAILDKVIAKDTEGCRTLMTQHIDDTYASMISQIE